MTHPSFEFTHALCRLPAKSVTDGLRASDHGDPDPVAFAVEHAAYISALREAGCVVNVLPADEAFPDSVFIEDPALVLNGTAIVLRPGAASRLGEAAALRPALLENMNKIIDLITVGYCARMTACCWACPRAPTCKAPRICAPLLRVWDTP
jgi:dimethylargininase